MKRESRQRPHRKKCSAVIFFFLFSTCRIVAFSSSATDRFSYVRLLQNNNDQYYFILFCYSLDLIVIKIMNAKSAYRPPPGAIDLRDISYIYTTTSTRSISHYYRIDPRSPPLG